MTDTRRGGFAARLFAVWRRAAGRGGRDNTFGAFGDNVTQRFTGQERNQETWSDFFQARYYHGGQGRFNSPDLANAGADLSDPETWNGCSYLRNAPGPNLVRGFLMAKRGQ